MFNDAKADKCVNGLGSIVRRTAIVCYVICVSTGTVYDAMIASRLGYLPHRRPAGRIQAIISVVFEVREFHQSANVPRSLLDTGRKK